MRQPSGALDSRRPCQSGGGPPQSKTLPRQRKLFAVHGPDAPPRLEVEATPEHIRQPASGAGVENDGGDGLVLLPRSPHHNGRPLPGQISASWPEAFAWEHLVRKPDEVRVKITRLKAVKEDLDLPAAHACSH